jgi:DNA-binding GntR family transcriptional regulator
MHFLGPRSTIGEAGQRGLECVPAVMRDDGRSVPDRPDSSSRSEPGAGTRTKAGVIADGLREAIAGGALAAGTRLSQDELATRFSTSTTPVREALRQLVAEGLVDTESHRGYKVSAPDFDRITAVYVLRRLVEPFAVRRAASRLSRQDFARAQRINDELLAAQQADDQQLARQLNREFHFVFYNACGLTAVVTEIERFWGMFPWSELHIVRRSESFEEHQQILEAVIADDQPEIQRLLELHMRNGYVGLIKHLGHSVDVDPFEVSALE